MYKYLLVAALATVALPVMAQDASAPVPGQMGGHPMMGGMGEHHEMRLEEMKKMAGQKHQEMIQRRNAARAEEDAHEEKCFQGVMAATSMEQMRSVHEQCQKEREEMHAKHEEERKAMEEKMKAEHEEMKAHHEEWKANHDDAIHN